jgi:hypothetical protein
MLKYENSTLRSGKSTLCRIARSLIDPSEAPITTLPRGERNLHIATSKSWMQVYDNVSNIKPDFSDSLCRLITGAGLHRRKLMTDDTESLCADYNSMRPLQFNNDMVRYGVVADWQG